MNAGSRRYFFVDYQDLKQVKFRKLEKVCDKVYVFISSDEDNIPFRLVQQMQRFGKRARWVVIEPPFRESGLNYHMCFFIGKLHQKVGKDVEFAILSNDTSFDSLVNFINIAGGRSCLRVKRQNDPTERRNASEATVYPFENELELRTNDVNPTSATIISGYDSEADRQQEVKVEDIVTVSNGYDEQQMVERTADDTVSRLKRSGNRPLLLSSLKNYILLNNQELTMPGKLDHVIRHLEERNEIEVKEDEVTYFF